MFAHPAFIVPYYTKVKMFMLIFLQFGVDSVNTQAHTKSKQ